MKACFVSLSRIADDPRIRRHAAALQAAGWEVSAVGDAGARSAAPPWPVREIPLPARDRREKLTRLLRMGASRVQPSAVERRFWSDPFFTHLEHVVADEGADVVVANDWPVLPVAARVARRTGAALVYDSHEYGVGEHAERLKWRLFYPTWVHALELANAPSAARVLTVSDGIAELLQRDLGLAQRPTVIRNMPPYQQGVFRPAGDVLEVLYQGVFAPDRGLELLIAAAARWRPGRVLVLRGLGDARYVAGLRRRAEGNDRVRFDPPAAPAELIAAAGRSDVGIHPIPGVTPQTRLCLPNKFFEYAMAGLALCVSDVPEMAALTREHQLGVLIPEPTPDAVAAAVSGLERNQVDGFKQAALRAATVLNWEAESELLVGAFADLHRR